MKITVYAERIDKKYYTNLLYLEEKSNIELEFITANFFYLIFAKLYGLGILKFMKNKYVPEIPSIKDIFKSIFAFFILPFRKKIILSFEAYSSIIYYLIFLKLLNKDVIFYTSWPHWFNDGYVRRPLLISRKLWKSFLKDIKIICVTKQCVNNFKDLGFTSYFIPHTVDTSLFGVKKNDKITKLVYVGRLVEEKGLKDLIDVFYDLRKKYNISLCIAGEGNLKSYIIKKSDGKNLIYLGYIRNLKDLVHLYSNSDIFILNSYKTKKWEEVFGISLIESMAAGLAIISTNCIGPKEIIKDMWNGLLIDQKDKHELKFKLDLLIQNKKLRESLGKNAKKFVKENYDVKKVSNNLLNILVDRL